MCVTSANLIIRSAHGRRSKEEVNMCVEEGGGRQRIYWKFFAELYFLLGKSERRINQRRASVRNTSPYADGARKTDATYSIN